MSPEFEAVLAAMLDLGDRESLIKAAKQAQFLLEQDRLQRPVGQQGAIGSFLLREAPAAKHLAVWLRMLAIQFAGYNGCRVIRGQSPKNSLWIVGRDVVVKPVRRAYLTMTVKLEELAQQAQPPPNEVPPQDNSKRQWARKQKNSWRMALMRELDSALEEGAKEAQEALGLYPDTSLKWEQKTVLRWMKQYLQLMPLRRNVSKK